MQPTKYGDGEFERAYAEHPVIVLRYPYPGGISTIDLLMLPLVVERLQAEHPRCTLCVRSVHDEGSGAEVTITVEDREDRNGDVFTQEVVVLQTKLHCVEAERDRLLYVMVPHLMELIAKSKQTNFIGPFLGPSAKGVVMSTFNTTADKIGALGENVHVHDVTFQQIWDQSGIDLAKLARELEQLRNAMKRELIEGTIEQDEAVVAVTVAQKEATAGNGPAALQHLKRAGAWTLGVAEKIGVAVASEALKKAML